MRHHVTRLCLSVALAAGLSPMLALVHAQGMPQQAPAAANVPTPKTASGVPDFSGVWVNTGGPTGYTADESGNLTSTRQARRGGSALSTASADAQLPINFERDSGINQRSDGNKPLYKPEYWSKVQTLDENGNAQDPSFRCLPDGVPRMGPPAKIVQTPTEMIFLYGLRMTRVIPIDGRPLPPEDTWEGLWNGTSVGHWEGDTLVIETVDFNDESWLAWPGYFHTPDLKVVERMRRDGNTLRWEATAYDPRVLLAPWTLNPRMLRVNPDPKALLPEDLPCSERDLHRIVTKERG